MIEDLIKIGEPTIGLLQFSEDDGSPARGCNPRYIAVVKVKYLRCGCEHTTQSELDLAAIQFKLHGKKVTEGRVKQLLMAETRKLCRQVGCPTCDQGMVCKQ
jgi:hypothetical protein